MPGSPRIDLGEGFVRHQELLQELRLDIDAAYETLEQNRESQYLRRCVVRAIFSFIEAAIESIKVDLRSTVRTHQFSGALTDKETETLGSLHIIGPRQDRFLPLDQNIKRTFRLATKIWKLKGFKLATSGPDFQDFLSAKSARNRLTHPKTFYDIEVNDHDMHCHAIAGMWVQSEMERLFDASINALAEELPEKVRTSFLKRYSHLKNDES